MSESEGVRWRADRGKYQWRLRYKDALNVWRERSGFEATKAAAKRARRSAEQGLDLSAGMTLAEWKDHYWPVLDGRLASGTLRAYDVAWRRRVAPALGSMRLSEINPFVIETAMARWTGSASTKRDALAVLANLLRGASNARLVSQIATSAVTRPREPRRDPTSRALTVDELDQLLTLVPAGPYRRFIAAMAYTGCRLGEVAGLRAGDIDISRRVIHVRQQASPGRRGEMEHRAPKSGRHREVPIVDQFMPYAEAAIAGVNRLSLAFPGPRGGRVSSTNLARALDWNAMRLQVRRFGADESRLRFHDLRHTFATLLFDAGVSATDVQAVLGHASLQVTQKYSTARADAAQRGGDRLSALLRGPHVAQGAQPGPSDQEGGIRTDR